MRHYVHCELWLPARLLDHVSRLNKPISPDISRWTHTYSRISTHTYVSSGWTCSISNGNGHRDRTEQRQSFRRSACQRQGERITTWWHIIVHMYGDNVTDLDENSSLNSILWEVWQVQLYPIRVEVRDWSTTHSVSNWMSRDKLFFVFFFFSFILMSFTKTKYLAEGIRFVGIRHSSGCD